MSSAGNQMIMNHSACRSATMPTALPLLLKLQGKQVQEWEHIRYECWGIGSDRAKSPSFFGVCVCVCMRVYVCVCVCVCVFLLYPICQWLCFTAKKNGGHCLYVIARKFQGLRRLISDREAHRKASCWLYSLRWPLTLLKTVCISWSCYCYQGQEARLQDSIRKQYSKFKTINEDNSNGRYDSEKKKNGEYRKTSAVWHNSREALLTNYFP